MRNLGMSKVVNTSFIWLALIPFLARVLDSIKEVGGAKLALPFNFEAFYFAAVCFTIASMIFAIWCPDIVKLAPDFGTFVTKGHSGRELKRWFHKLAPSKNHKGEIDIGPITQFFENAGFSVELSKKDLGDFFAGKAPNELMGKFWSIDIQNKLADLHDFTLNQSNCRSPVARWFAAIFYILGFLLFACVAASNLVAVFSITMRHWYGE